MTELAIEIKKEIGAKFINVKEYDSTIEDQMINFIKTLLSKSNMMEFTTMTPYISKSNGSFLGNVDKQKVRTEIYQWLNRLEEEVKC